MTAPADRRQCDQGCRQAADLAVRRVFEVLGVDIDKPESVEEFREDLRFGKRLRRAADNSAMALAAAVAVALVAALWTGIVSRIGGH